MSVVCFPLDSGSFVGEDVRQALAVVSGLYAPSGRPLGATSGVRPGTPATTVTVAGAGPYTWSCGVFGAYLDVAASTTAGPYALVNDAAITAQAINANPGVGQQRNDIIYAAVNDTAESVGSGNTPTVSYVAGTAATAGSQVDPAVPSNGLALARLTASNTGAPTVTWLAASFNPDKAPPVWTAMTPASGTTVNSFGFAPAYNLNAATGLVTIRGGFAKSTTSWAGGTTATLVTALPAGVRPAQTVEFVGTTTNSGNTNVVRVELTTGGLLQAVFSAGMTGTYTWVNIDSNSYYIN